MEGWSQIVVPGNHCPFYFRKQLLVIEIFIYIAGYDVLDPFLQQSTEVYTCIVGQL